MRCWRGNCFRRVRCPERGLRRMSPGNAGGLKDKTLKQYRRVLCIFLTWLSTLGLQPETAAEYDDLLVEFRYGVDGAPPMSKGNLEHLVSAVERVLPHLKGQLTLIHHELSSWKVHYQVRHAQPLLPSWAHMVAYGMLRAGYPAVAAALLLQSLTGLRPGELLSVKVADLFLPGDPGGTPGVGFILLSSAAGTKAGRRQGVRVLQPLALFLMALFRAAFSPERRLTHLYTLGGYAYVLQLATRAMGLDWAGWRPHSPRAGYVTWRHFEGDRRDAIMEVTRHLSVKSFRSYLDVEVVLAGTIATRMAPLGPTLVHLQDTLPKLLTKVLLSGPQVL